MQVIVNKIKRCKTDSFTGFVLPLLNTILINKAGFLLTKEITNSVEDQSNLVNFINFLLHDAGWNLTIQTDLNAIIFSAFINLYQERQRR